MPERGRIAAITDLKISIINSIEDEYIGSICKTSCVAGGFVEASSVSGPRAIEEVDTGAICGIQASGDIQITGERAISVGA